MSDSVQPHRRQPTRLPRPWDSPGKNNGVGCHFLLQCMKVKSESEVAQSCPTLSAPWTAAHQAPPSLGFSRQEYRSEVPLPSPMITLQIAKQRQQQKLKQHEFKHQHLKIFLVQNSFFSSFLSCEKNIKYKQTYIVLPLHID